MDILKALPTPKVSLKIQGKLLVSEGGKDAQLANCNNLNKFGTYVFPSLKFSNLKGSSK